MIAPLEGLGYEDSTPLGFQSRAELPEGRALAGLNAELAEVLVADASLDEQRPAHHDVKHDEEHALAEDLQRIEFKVNVLIQLVARLMKREDSVPPVRHWRLHGEGVEWLVTDDAPAPGLGLVSLFVSRNFPQPLVLPGRVTGTRDDQHGRWSQFRFEGLAPTSADLLEKLIFRHHRRAVAGTRGHSRA